MVAPLALFAAYAYSAKKKGDRRRAAEKAKFDADQAAKKAENAMGTLFKMSDGSLLVAADDDLAAQAQAKIGNATPLKYAKLNSLSYDFPANQTVTDIYFDGTREGPISSFSNEQQVGMKGTIPYKVGVKGPDGITKYDEKHMIDLRRNGEKGTSTSEIMIEVSHPKLEGGSFSGSLGSVTAELADKGISQTDKNLTALRYAENTDVDGNVTRTSVADYNFGGDGDADSGGESDIRYTMKDGSVIMGSSGTYVDPDNIDYMEYGSVDSGGTFRPTSMTNPTEAAAQKSGLAAALEASNSAYSYEFGNSYIAASNEDSVPERLSTFFTQLSNNIPMVNDINEKYKQGNPAATITVENVERDLMAQFNEVKFGPNGAILATYNMSMTYDEFLQQQYGGAIQLIPSLLERAKAIAAEDTVKQKITLTEQASTDSITATVAVVNTDTPPELAALPDVPAQTQTYIVNRYPSKYDTLVNQSLRPLIKTRITNPVGPNGQEISIDEAAEIVLGNFIDYRVDAQGIRLRDANNNLIPEDNQPALQLMEELRVKGIAGSTQNQLDFLVGTMLDPRKSFVDQLNNTGKDVVLEIADAMNGDIKATTMFIAPLMASGKGADVAMGKKYGFEQDPAVKRDFLNGQLGVLAASRRGISVANAALSTYYGPNGELLAPTALANIFLAFEGVEYYAGKAADFLGIDFGNEAAVVQAGTEYIVNARNNLRQSGILIEDSTARDQIEAELKEAANGKYAQREFFTLVLAYEVAAAIQGGTGGRTISDQDVALIFRGLRQRFSDGPEAQVAALNAVRGMLQQFEYRAQMLTQDTKTRAAYMTAENFLFAAGIDVAPRFTTTAYVTKELGPRGATPAADQANGDPYFGLGADGYNTRLLKKANDSNLTGRPYPSLDDVPQRKLDSAKKALDAELGKLQQTQGTSS